MPMAGCISNVPTKATLLVCQDVGYEFLVEDWVDLFRTTGAIAAQGYINARNKFL